MFEITMEVRDYECDLQGIVNNAVYQNYLEHARHKYLKENGIDFSEYAEKGYNFVIVRAEIDYKKYLKPGDVFIVSVDLKRASRLKFEVNQIIKKENQIIIKAKFVITTIDKKGKIIIPSILNDLLPFNK